MQFFPACPSWSAALTPFFWRRKIRLALAPLVMLTYEGRPCQVGRRCLTRAPTWRLRGPDRQLGELKGATDGTAIVCYFCKPEGRATPPPAHYFPLFYWNGRHRQPEYIPLVYSLASDPPAIPALYYIRLVTPETSDDENANFGSRWDLALNGPIGQGGEEEGVVSITHQGW